MGGEGGGRGVVGPRKSDEMPPEPVLLPVEGAHEVEGVGIIAPDKDGKPVLHIHASLGRGGRTLTGCLRPGVKTWLGGGGVVYEITGARARGLQDAKRGFGVV